MPVLLFHGDNNLELSEAALTIRARFNPADVLTFDGVGVSLPALSEACLTAGLFAPERLVMVQNVQDRLKGQRKESSDGDTMREIVLSVAPTTTLLLLATDLPSDHPVVGMVKAAGGEIQVFTTPRRQDLPRWIGARAKHRGASIGRDAADLLAELIGSNPVMLESEIEKLATYAGNEPISPSMVDLLVGQVTQESIFSLVDAVAVGDKAKAFHLLRSQLDAASATPTEFALYLIRMLARQMRILLRVRLGQQAGRSQGQIIADAKLPRYYADRYFRQAQRLSAQRLTASFERLASLEYALKSGGADAGPGLDILVAELCA